MTSGGLNTEEEEIHGGKKRRRSSSAESVVVTRTNPPIPTTLPNTSRLHGPTPLNTIPGISPIKVTSKSPAKPQLPPSTVIPTPVAAQKVIIVSSAGKLGMPVCLKIVAFEDCNEQCTLNACARDNVQGKSSVSIELKHILLYEHVVFCTRWWES